MGRPCRPAELPPPSRGGYSLPCSVAPSSAHCTDESLRSADAAQLDEGVSVLAALLAVLGVDLIVVVLLLATMQGRKRWVKRQPGAFRGQIRVADGELDGVGPKWRRGYGRWVREVLVWTKGPLLFRNEVLAFDRLEGERSEPSDQIKHLGDGPVVIGVRAGAHLSRSLLRTKTAPRSSALTSIGHPSLADPQLLRAGTNKGKDHNMPPRDRRQRRRRAAVVGGAAVAASRRRDARQQQEPPPAQPSEPAPPAEAGGLSSEAIQKLKELSALHEQNVLSDEEFEREKAKVLGS